MPVLFVETLFWVADNSGDGPNWGGGSGGPALNVWFVFVTSCAKDLVNQQMIHMLRLGLHRGKLS